MFKIESYLKHPQREIYNLDMVRRGSTHFFIDISNKEKVQKIKDMIDLEYLDGVIVITYDDKIILDYTMWDSIDQLWSYLVHLIDDFHRTGSAEMYFPDQPIKIEIRKISDTHMKLGVTVDEVAWLTCSIKEFTQAILNGAEQFFRLITQSLCLSDDYYEYELQEIEKLRQRILLA